ncbi:hypothetical protein F4604DRAFT_1661024 [Suillus subluteus]|nr:hypothetical protein F4604DRAFT_1661024 [Suillus subluteus]
MDVGSLFSAMRQHHELAAMSYIDLSRFLRYASLLKDDIIQPQPHTVSIMAAPDILPPSITNFLSDAVAISPESVDALWDITKDLAWVLPTVDEARADEETAFRLYGHQRGITSHTLYPPTKQCTNPECGAWQLGTVLKKEEQRQAVIFTHANGAHPACNLIVVECHTNYHNNYSVKDGIRTYYGGMPAYIQVAEHQFVQRELIMHWTDLMQIAVSATNCAHLYNIAQPRCDVHDNDDVIPWQFNSSLTTAKVWDSFTLLALLDDHDQRHVQLQVPHGGEQKDRYTTVMRERTERIIIHGHEELPHACDGCLRIFNMPDGTLARTEVVVTDGVTVGRPCCGVPRCKNPLENNRHRFCSVDPDHKKLETTCAVEGCDRPVTRDSKSGKYRKACDDPVHVKMEGANVESLRSGKSKTQRQKVAKLDNAMSSLDPPQLPADSTMALPIQDGDEWYEHDAQTGAVRSVRPAVMTSTGVLDTQPDPAVDCQSKDTPPKLKAIFRRQRTNNEQLVVRPCGVINGRGTMYHHEAVSNVLVMIEQLYSLPRARKPQHLIYDSNCNALREVLNRRIKFFDGMGMCVDAFHHKNKHKASDTFCRDRCDMKAYPELLDDDGKYYFNSSIAEQTNVWFGAFHNICREMTPVRYDFFLDEMIKQRNRVTVRTLHAQGRHPHPMS